MQKSKRYRRVEEEAEGNDDGGRTVGGTLGTMLITLLTTFTTLLENMNIEERKTRKDEKNIRNQKKKT